jgi:hypothetical protein
VTWENSPVAGFSGVVIMKVYHVPEKCLTGIFNSFGRTTALDGSFCREAFGENTLRFSFHDDNYMIESFS